MTAGDCTPCEPSGGAGFARFVAAVRGLMSLAVSTELPSEQWSDLAAPLDGIVQAMDSQPRTSAFPHRRADLPGHGTVMMPPFSITRSGPGEIDMSGEFPRYYQGFAATVYGGALPQLFDWLAGEVLTVADRGVAYTARMEVDYHAPVPIATPLTAHGRVEEAAGRKTVIAAVLCDSAGVRLASSRSIWVAPTPPELR